MEYFRKRCRSPISDLFGGVTVKNVVLEIGKKEEKIYRFEQIFHLTLEITEQQSGCCASDFDPI